MKVIEFIIANKAVILPFVALAYSEILSLYPGAKSNGLIQLVGNILKGKSHES